MKDGEVQQSGKSSRNPSIDVPFVCPAHSSMPRRLIARTSPRRDDQPADPTARLRRSVGLVERGLRQKLREKTRDAHQALEALLPISSAAPDAVIYADHLRFLLSFHEPVERRLRRLAALRRMVPDIDRRWKSPLLRRDLADAVSWPRPDETLLPDPRTPAAGLGVLYVLEGATLGARTLLPGLRAAGVLPGPLGGAYLEAYGSASGSMWRRFCELLERLPGDLDDEVAAAAVETFEAMIAWRREWDAEP